MMHAHVQTSATDCDGTYLRRYTLLMTEEQKTAEFGDIEFMNDVFTNLCGPFAVSLMSIEVVEGSVTWSERTEEGGRSGSITWCEEDCKDTGSEQRDLTAEAAGY